MLARRKVRRGCLMHFDCDGSCSCLVFVSGPTLSDGHVEGVARVFIRGSFSERVAIIQPNCGRCQDSIKREKPPYIARKEFT